MNKMTETEIHAVLDGVKAGDVLRTTYEGETFYGLDNGTILYSASNRILRWRKDSLATGLISIENLGQPEPEVGSFARLKSELGLALKMSNTIWLITGDQIPYAYYEIKPIIKTLYNPDGTINKGWE